MSRSTEAPEPLRIGIVGCGFVADHRHLPTLSKMPEATVVALCDSDPAALARVGDRWGIGRRHADPRALTEDASVEAVAVLVPAAGHAAVVIAALEAGRHVMVEKPLALTLDDADLMLEAAGASAGRVMVGFNERWHRLVREARDLVIRRQAWQFGIVPLRLDDGYLVAATSRRQLPRAVRFATRVLGMPVQSSPGASSFSAIS